MEQNVLKTKRRLRRKRGIRKRIFGTAERPRLTVFRSNQHVYAQIINDIEGKTLASMSSQALEKGSTVDAAVQVGKQLADKAREAGVETLAFDRNGFRYHGRVKALADAMREAGLKF
ncbi:MAG: 50S ribosomal protein L18 [Phycisphaeraceae bacterium]